MSTSRSRGMMSGPHDICDGFSLAGPGTGGGGSLGGGFEDFVSFKSMPSFKAPRYVLGRLVVLPVLV